MKRDLEKQLVLFILCLYVWTESSYADSVEKYKACNLPRRRKGECKHVKDCPSAISDLRSGIRATTGNCSDEKGIICCPTSPRISATMCEKYLKVLKKTGGPYPLLPPAFFEDDAPEDEEVYCNPKLNPLISGGREAQVGEFPHVVAIGYNVTNTPWRCGGTLISDQFVLTAAHCINNPTAGKPRMILLGDITLNKLTSTSRIISEVSEIFIHPGYDPPKTYNDLAILKLTSKVSLTRFVFPACLSQPENDLLKNTSARNFSAAGWGVLGTGEGQSDTLQVVSLDGFSKNSCNAFYNKAPAKQLKFPSGILRTQICAGDTVGRKDTCKGDSGGPLWLNIEKRCVFHLLGITSFGPNQCGEKVPGVYTNILSYLEWIEDIVWPN